MIQVLFDKTIKCSHCDKFQLNAVLKKYQLQQGDEFFLSVEQNEKVKLELQGVAVVDGDDVNIEFSATTEKMSMLDVGRYIYDIYIVNNGELVTTMFTAVFEVVEVAHDGQQD